MLNAQNHPAMFVKRVRDVGLSQVAHMIPCNSQVNTLTRNSQLPHRCQVNSINTCVKIDGLCTETDSKIDVYPQIRDVFVVAGKGKSSFE